MSKIIYPNTLRVLPWLVGTACLTASASGGVGMMIDHSHTIEFATVGGALSTMFGVFAAATSQQRVGRNIVAGSALGLGIFFSGVAVKQSAVDPTPVFSAFTVSAPSIPQ